MDTDLSKLQTPTFTIDKAQSLSMMQLDWNHEVDLIGKKVINPMIHCCDKCQKPILVYGRMIPCKHVFCFDCSKAEGSKCSRCGDSVVRVEQVGLGSIYMCTHGGSRRSGTGGCQRTYLSQRDLQAHIRHRHIKTKTEKLVKAAVSTSQSSEMQHESTISSILAQPTYCSTKKPRLSENPVKVIDQTSYNVENNCPLTQSGIETILSQTEVSPISVISSDRPSYLVDVPIEPDLPQLLPPPAFSHEQLQIYTDSTYVQPSYEQVPSTPPPSLVTPITMGIPQFSLPPPNFYPKERSMPPSFRLPRRTSSIGSYSLHPQPRNVRLPIRQVQQPLRGAMPSVLPRVRHNLGSRPPFCNRQ